MCYNCGCGLPDDDMGVGHALASKDGKSITDKTFSVLSEKWNLPEKEVKRISLGLLTGETEDADKLAFLESLCSEAGKSQGMSLEESKEETLKLLKQILS